jgi:hypothetical protein
MSRLDPWSPAELAGAERDYEAGVKEAVIATRYGKTPGQIRGKAIRLQWHKPMTGRAKVLHADTAAAVEGRTIFPGQVRNPLHARDVLQEGRWQRKLGNRVTKGEWQDMPLYSLTLEERATCPETCHHWLSCVVPETPVLTADLRWVAIGSLTVGDRICGFDEFPKDGDRRKSRIAIVEGLGRATVPCFRVATDRGVVITSGDHGWLGRKKHTTLAGRKGYRWLSTAELRLGDTIQFLAEPWEEDRSYEAGRIRGFVEGEGCVGAFGATGQKKARLNWAQRPGPLLDEINALVEAKGFQVVTREALAGVNHSLIAHGNIAGGWREVLRFLGTFRPTRLLDRSEVVYSGQILDGRKSKAARVLSVEPLGEREVVTIATSTKTFVAKGLLSHNCMGNTMQWAIRLRAGPALEYELRRALCRLQAKHPAGFVVRLHVLGDFYSVRYVERWAFWLQCFPALRVFGYTARTPDTPIGAAVARLARRRWDRFAIRLSAEEAGPGRAITLWADDGFAGLDTDQHVILCPAQEGKTDGCGTCGLCWAAGARDATIAFTAHGAS